MGKKVSLLIRALEMVSFVSGFVQAPSKLALVFMLLGFLYPIHLVNDSSPLCHISSYIRRTVLCNTSF